jgi:hypothetical protein
MIGIFHPFNGEIIYFAAFPENIIRLMFDTGKMVGGKSFILHVIPVLLHKRKQLFSSEHA